MQELADDLMAVADMPPSRVIDQALELDRFCAEVDPEIGVNLVSQGPPLSGTKPARPGRGGWHGARRRRPDSSALRRRRPGAVQPAELREHLVFPESIKTFVHMASPSLLDVPRSTTANGSSTRWWNSPNALPTLSRAS